MLGGAPLAYRYYVLEPGTDVTQTNANATEDIDAANLFVSFTTDSATTQVLMVMRAHAFVISAGSAACWWALRKASAEKSSTRMRMATDNATVKQDRTYQRIFDVSPSTSYTWNMAWRQDTASQFQITLVADLDAAVELEVWPLAAAEEAEAEPQPVTVMRHRTIRPR